MKRLFKILALGLYLIPVLAFALPMGNISENFDAASRDTTLWSAFTTNTTSAQTGGRWVFTTIAATGYAGYDSLATYDLTGQRASMQIIGTAPSQASLEIVPISLSADANNRVFIYINNGTLAAYKTVATVQTQITSVVYSSATMQYFSMREQGGTLFYEYSADGKKWTVLTSLANPITLTALTIEPSVGHYAAETGTTVTMDNFNILPALAFWQFGDF